jgi:hypothetical protein
MAVGVRSQLVLTSTIASAAELLPLLHFESTVRVAERL